MMGQPGPPQVHARTVGTPLHRLITEVARYDALCELGAPSALEAHEVRRADWDHAGVPAAAGRAGEAVELLVGFKVVGHGAWGRGL